jgi:hypothetical protein
MEDLHLEYYRQAFTLELKQLSFNFGKILDHAENDDIRLSELNRNMKAMSWLNKTYVNNLDLYESTKEKRARKISGDPVKQS